jgi:hypothetical protein
VGAHEIDGKTFVSLGRVAIGNDCARCTMRPISSP